MSGCRLLFTSYAPYLSTRKEDETKSGNYLEIIREQQVTLRRRVEMDQLVALNVRYEGDNEASQVFQLTTDTQWPDLEAMVNQNLRPVLS